MTTAWKKYKVQAYVFPIAIEWNNFLNSETKGELQILLVFFSFLFSLNNFENFLEE